MSFLELSLSSPMMVEKSPPHEQVKEIRSHGIVITVDVYKNECANRASCVGLGIGSGRFLPRT